MTKSELQIMINEMVEEAILNEGFGTEYVAYKELYFWMQLAKQTINSKNKISANNLLDELNTLINKYKNTKYFDKNKTEIYRLKDELTKLTDNTPSESEKYEKAKNEILRFKKHWDYRYLSLNLLTDYAFLDDLALYGIPVNKTINHFKNTDDIIDHHTLSQITASYFGTKYAKDIVKPEDDKDKYFEFGLEYDNDGEPNNFIVYNYTKNCAQKIVCSGQTYKIIKLPKLYNPETNNMYIDIIKKENIKF